MKPRLICYLLSAALFFAPLLSHRTLPPCSPAEQQQLTEMVTNQQNASVFVFPTVHCSMGPVSWADMRKAGPGALKLVWKPLAFALFLGLLAVVIFGELLYGIWFLVRHFREGKQHV
jgi:hypothetical protein